MISSGASYLISEKQQRGSIQEITKENKGFSYPANCIKNKVKGLLVKETLFVYVFSNLLIKFLGLITPNNLFTSVLKSLQEPKADMKLPNLAH